MGLEAAAALWERSRLGLLARLERRTGDEDGRWSGTVEENCVDGVESSARAYLI